MSAITWAQTTVMYKQYKQALKNLTLDIEYCILTSVGLSELC